jgi:hypothetical protein
MTYKHIPEIAAARKDLADSWWAMRKASKPLTRLVYRAYKKAEQEMIDCIWSVR